MKGGDYKVRTKYPYRSEGQSRSTKQQPVMRNNQDSHINGSHLCPSSGRQANLCCTRRSWKLRFAIACFSDCVQ
ncbi:hypothetical protein T07_1452 [Trichinella nelsoni]|uniref:Uncharacterized protein n=1 Tax=Trichinella nelsoni TaxID=6336 RepID=A0A0V0REJ0_9BILA|nr:hypothetical protein T07_3959 [Trichinella nelsoni]KRX15511.1 hypothetical protein T07_6483 [Trichinella nelsoni]KRX16554.1 hypothetical protein T07_1452 [Trichinella nelsoni]